MDRRNFRLPGACKSMIGKLLPVKAAMRCRAIEYWLMGPPEIRFLHRLCCADAVSIDVGANIGIYTDFLARHSRHAYAFEPNPGLAVELRKKIARRNVTVVEM